MKSESKEILKSALKDIIKNFYEVDGNQVGGRLHVVLEDVNISESMILSYLKEEGLSDLERLILISLLTIDAKERAEICYGRQLTLDEAIDCLDEEDAEEIEELRLVYGDDYE